MAAPVLAPAEGAIAELALVLLLGGEGRLADARRGGAGGDGHAGGHDGLGPDLDGDGDNDSGSGTQSDG
jgi:hypothetical protein